MNYPGYENEEIAKIVSYAIATNREEARRRYSLEYHKDAPPVRTIRDWKKRFMDTLSVLPKSSAPKSHPNELPEAVKTSVVSAFGDGYCRSQREASREFNISVSSVNKVLKEKGLKAYKYKVVQELKFDDFPKR